MLSQAAAYARKKPAGNSLQQLFYCTCPYQGILHLPSLFSCAKTPRSTSTRLNGVSETQNVSDSRWGFRIFICVLPHAHISRVIFHTYCKHRTPIFQQGRHATLAQNSPLPQQGVQRWIPGAGDFHTVWSAHHHSVASWETLGCEYPGIFFSIHVM